MKVAVLGYGTVGYGVYGMLEKAAGLEPGPVLVRPGKVDADFKVSSIDDIVNDASIGAVAEVMGGLEPAYSYVSAALKAGKHVVSSNKALVAAYGIELAKLARENNVAFLFSAACGGAVPFLHNLAIAAETDEIKTLGGILNGTTNFMLDSMQRQGGSYADALAEAQRLGYAEADPTADVSGLDTLRKIMLACAVAFDILPEGGMYNEGIESLSAEDVADFKALGLTCRLLAKGGRNEDGSAFAYVEPTLLPYTAAECSVYKNFNLARYDAQCAGPIVLMGQGAGRWPTASALLRDLSCILQGQREMLLESCHRADVNNDAAMSCYYVRLPASSADALPAAECRIEGDIARIKTEKISVSKMHNTAKALREAGANVFFAGIEE